MLYQHLLRKLYIHKYRFTFGIDNNIELPINFIQFFSDSFKKALDDVAKDKAGKFNSIRHTHFDYLYSTMHFPEAVVEMKSTKKNNIPPKIATTHPCYNYLKNYAALPWWIQPAQPVFSTKLKKSDTFSFHFYICGEYNQIWQTPVWFDVLFQWAKNGLGIENMKATLVQIDEVHPNHEDNTIFTNSSNEVFAPMLPVSIQDFDMPQIHQLQLKLLSPTNLSKYYAAFSFNYVAERVLKRALCLQALFCKSNIFWTENNATGNFQLFKFEKIATENNAILYPAQHIITQEINIIYSNQYHQSPNIKNDQQNSFSFRGFCGQINYTDNTEKLGLLAQFVPLFKLAEYINVGDKIRYGNGWVKCYV